MNPLLLAQALRQVPDSNQDGYDYQGYAKQFGVPAPFNTLQDYQHVTGRHLGDSYKMPNHITFSDGSFYSAPDMQGGAWQRGGSEESGLWNFKPSQFNVNQQGAGNLKNYFKTRETKNTTLTLPSGEIVWGSQ